MKLTVDIQGSGETLEQFIRMYTRASVPSAILKHVSAGLLQAAKDMANEREERTNEASTTSEASRQVFMLAERIRQEEEEQFTWQPEASSQASAK